MTIFGFNTDVKSGDTVYHVQSEARRAELVIQTLVFVKGQCIGKRTTPYSQTEEDSVHEQLKAHHKKVIEAINEGKLDSVLAANSGTHSNPPHPSANGTSNGASASAGQMITIEFQITDAGQAVPGAEVVSRAGTSAQDAVVARAVSDSSGTVRIDLPYQESMQHEPITIEAIYAGKRVTRKFRFKGMGKKPQ